MKLAFLGNNHLGLQVLSWLKKQGEEIVALGVHPMERAKCRQEMIDVAGCGDEALIEGPGINSDVGTHKLLNSGCELLLSVGFGYILKPEALRVPPRGCLNLHIAYLPYGRGSNPNVWSIVENASAGVTLHYIDSGIDTGDIVAQRRVKISWEDNGGTLYEKLTKAAYDLFIEVWPDIVEGRAVPRKQLSGLGSFHRDRDLSKLDLIDLDRSYKARDLINILRARTFPPYHGAYFIAGGERYYLSLAITKGRQE